MSLRRARPTNAALAEELDLLPQRLVHERLGVCRHGTMTWGAGAVLCEFGELSSRAQHVLRCESRSDTPIVVYWHLVYVCCVCCSIHSYSFKWGASN